MGDGVATGATWVDIVAPAPVTDALSGAWLGVLLVSLVMLIMVGAWLGSRPRPRARRTLRRLARASLPHQQDARQACQRITLCLREGLAQPRLSRMVFGAPYQTEWQQFLMRLQHYRFAAQAPSPAQCRQAAADALVWLSVRGAPR